MDASKPKRRISKKKLPNVTYPEEIVCQYSRLWHLLSHDASRKWLLYEWEYDEIEDAFFHKTRTFDMYLNANLPHLKTRDLTRTEWRVIRKMIIQRKCRRFSSKFITEQRIELERYRCSYRILRECNRHDQLVKLNGFHDDVNEFISTLDSQQSQNHQLFRTFIELKKLFATKSVLITKIREINNNCVEMQQQQEQQQEQQHAIINGNLNMEPAATANAAAIKLLTEMQTCNQDIMSKLNQLMCSRFVKDALLINALKRKNITMSYSLPYFQLTNSVQLYESQQLHRSQTFVNATDLQTLLNTLLMQLLVALDYDVVQMLTECAKRLADDLINENRSVVNAILSNDSMIYYERDCLQRYFAILNTLRELSK